MLVCNRCQIAYDQEKNGALYNKNICPLCEANKQIMALLLKINNLETRLLYSESLTINNL